MTVVVFEDLLVQGVDLAEEKGLRYVFSLIIEVFIKT